MSRKPSVAMAVGSGAIPKTSAPCQGRPNKGASSGIAERQRDEQNSSPATPVSRLERQPVESAAQDQKEQRLDREQRRRIDGRPIDGRRSVPTRSSSRPTPTERRAGSRSAGPIAADAGWRRASSRVPSGEHHQRQRPERRVVQLEHPPIDPRREQQEVGESVAPVEHQRRGVTAARHRPPCGGASPRPAADRSPRPGSRAHGRRGWWPGSRP